jgi:hypothetical protein
LRKIFMMRDPAKPRGVVPIPREVWCERVRQVGRIFVDSDEVIAREIFMYGGGGDWKE